MDGLFGQSMDQSIDGCIFNLLTSTSGGGGGGGGVTWRLFWYGCAAQFFFKPTPIINLVCKKNDRFIYLNEQNVYIFIYCSLIFIYPLCGL